MNKIVNSLVSSHNFFCISVVGEDFTTPSNTTSFTLSIDNNTQGGIEANVTLGILDDQTIEGDHGFVVTIMTSPNYSLGASTSRAVIIVDTTDGTKHDS